MEQTFVHILRLTHGPSLNMGYSKNPKYIVVKVNNSVAVSMLGKVTVSLHIISFFLYLSLEDPVEAKPFSAHHEKTPQRFFSHRRINHVVVSSVSSPFSLCLETLMMHWTSTTPKVMNSVFTDWRWSKRGFLGIASNGLNNGGHCSRN